MKALLALAIIISFAIDLYFDTIPTADTTYTVIRPEEPTSSSQVVMFAGKLITATFANVPIENNMTTAMVSGTIVVKAQ